MPVRVITQNVDGLHQLAGMPARKVLELHGTAREFVCTECHARGPMEDALARVEAGEDDPPCLKCGGILKSATVMFGQRLDPVVLGDALAITKACQVFIAVGTSLQVQPAAGLAGVAADHGAQLIIVNAEPTRTTTEPTRSYGNRSARLCLNCCAGCGSPGQPRRRLVHSGGGSVSPPSS